MLLLTLSDVDIHSGKLRTVVTSRRQMTVLIEIAGGHVRLYRFRRAFQLIHFVGILSDKSWTVYLQNQLSNYQQLNFI